MFEVLKEAWRVKCPPKPFLEHYQLEKLILNVFNCISVCSLYRLKRPDYTPEVTLMTLCIKHGEFWVDVSLI